MDNKKMIETIEKKLEVKVEKVLEVKQDGKEVIADVKVGETSCRKVVLKESKNQYGTYYRFVSASEYELKVEAEPKKAEKKSSGKLRTKTETESSETRTMGTERRGWAWNSEMGLISSFILPHS